jgi:hypothetical protein
MRTLRNLRRLARFTAFALVAAAVATELSKPAPERTWHGKVGGVVPYDFRPPTWQRIREAYWNTQSEHLLSDRVFGVGWAVNLYRVKTLIEDAFRRLTGAEGAVSIRMTVQSERRGHKPDVVITRE